MSKISKIDITQLQAWDFFFSGWPNVLFTSRSSNYLNSEILEITSVALELSYRDLGNRTEVTCAV